MGDGRMVDGDRWTEDRQRENRWGNGYVDKQLDRCTMNGGWRVDGRMDRWMEDGWRGWAGG